MVIFNATTSRKDNFFGINFRLICEIFKENLVLRYWHGLTL